MEYGTRTTANHLKHQHEQLSSAAGEPIAVVDCDTDGDIVIATGIYQREVGKNCIAITTSSGIAEHTIEHGSELLIGFEAIDEYVESALDLYEDENEGDVQAGITAVALINRFPDHFSALPVDIIAAMADDICGSSEYIDYIVAREAGDAMHAQIDTIMRDYVRQFRSSREALQISAVNAYLAACTDINDRNAQIEYLEVCRRT